LNIAIIGQACVDEIVSASGKIRSRSLGGILYSYAALERLAQESKSPLTILPIGFYAVPDSQYLDPLLRELHHFHFKRLANTETLTNRVQLVYHTDSDRTEHCPTILPTISRGDLRRDHFEGIDALCVNMISGFDITLEAMEQVAAWSDELGFQIHLDIHALALGPLSQGKGSFGGGRKAQGLMDWHRWIAAAHTIQLNELEADHIGEPEFGGQDRLIGEIKKRRSDGQLPRLRAVILTRAAKGAVVHDLEHGTEIELPAPPTTVIDSTGSGDVFGACFTYELANGFDLITATGRSIEMATWNTQLRSIEEILTIAR
jgi:sugar/nucleoside kinase (ribokinase family)